MLDIAPPSAWVSVRQNLWSWTTAITNVLLYALVFHGRTSVTKALGLYQSPALARLPVARVTASTTCPGVSTAGRISIFASAADG